MSNLIVLGGYISPKMATPFLAKKIKKKKDFKVYPKTWLWYQNQPSIICRVQVIAIQNLSIPNNTKISKAHNTPSRVFKTEKNFIAKLYPKMIKIGEIRVLSYLHLPRNAPNDKNNKQKW